MPDSNKLRPFKAWAIIRDREIASDKNGFRVFDARAKAKSACESGDYVARVFIIAVE